MKLKGRREMEWGDLVGVFDVSKRATELEAQKMAQKAPGYAFAVLEVGNVFTTDVAPVIEKQLDDLAGPQVEQEAPEGFDFGDVVLREGVAVLR